MNLVLSCKSNIFVQKKLTEDLQKISCITYFNLFKQVYDKKKSSKIMNKWKTKWFLEQSDQDQHCLSHLMIKPTKWHVAPSEDSDQPGHPPMTAWRKVSSLATYWVRSEDSDQAGQMPRVIWVFVGCILLVLTWGGSFVIKSASTGCITL